ncbi:hypothetical protein PV762_00430 [Mitsuaria sp. CC2]|uniref:hypothetical protein n=1 Tax=Mitsuaria sp. CC2 TaxID=3029186 RepID=UPI003B8BB2BA
MPHVSAPAYWTSSPPIGFTAEAAVPGGDSRKLDLPELATQVERYPAHSAHSAHAVHRLLLGPADPDRPSNLHLATQRGDKATVQGLLHLFEHCSKQGKLTPTQCCELLRGDGARRGSEPGRDSALAIAIGGSGQMHRALMFYYVRAFLGERITVGGFESLMTGWLRSDTAARTAALDSSALEDWRHYFIHCVWAAYDDHWLGSAPLVRMMTLVGHDLRVRPRVGSLNLLTGALTPGSESTSSVVLQASRPGRMAQRLDESAVRSIGPTLDSAKHRRRLLAPPMPPQRQAPMVHDHPVDAARGRRRLLAPADGLADARDRYQDR